MPRRKRFVGQEWASRDLNRIMAVMALLVAGRLFTEVFFYLGVIAGAAVLMSWCVRALRREHRYRTTDPSPFWADKIER
jgi:hypothetical protein